MHFAARLKKGQRIHLFGWLGRYTKNIRSIRTAVSLLAAVVLWELVARYIVRNALFFAPVSAIYRSAIKLWTTGELQQHMWTSGAEVMLGYTLGSLGGIIIAAIVASSDVLRDYADPWISAAYATPLLALSPLFILWFGLEMKAKVAIILLVVLFPVLINTYAGLKSTPEHLIECARAFGASTWQVFRKVRLPSALPFIIAGERVAVARALTGVVVAEMFGATSGVGYLILVSAQKFDSAALFLGVLILAGAGVIVSELLKRLEQALAPWRSPSN